MKNSLLDVNGLNTWYDREKMVLSDRKSTRLNSSH